MSIVSQKLLRQVILERRQICLFLWKKGKFMVKLSHSSIIPVPYGRDAKIQHTTSEW